MWKDKGLQLVIAETNYLGRIHISAINRMTISVHQIERYPFSGKDLFFNSCHLLLVNDEEVKKGDHYVIELPKVNDNLTYLEIETCKSREGDWIVTDDTAIKRSINYCKKIIASTATYLKIPQFPDSFLEEYVKRYNSKKSLEVEVDCNEVVWQQSSDRYDDNDVYCNGEKVASFDYRLQEEEMDRFTDRLGKQPKVNSDNTIHIRFKEEKKYSRGEVEKLCGKAFDAGEAYRTGSCEGFKQIHLDKHDWIKENLK